MATPVTDPGSGWGAAAAAVAALPHNTPIASHFAIAAIVSPCPAV
ncbi:hypothetical protein [Lysobacter silvisoli]|nr:hypothetical protein [Lysobacter silvisoli]